VADGAVLAHGFAVRQDLPIPYDYALVAAALALIVSFAGLAFLWPRPRFEDATVGRPVPRLGAVLDSSPFRWVLRILGLAGTGLILSAAVIGPDDALNPTAGAVYVVFWIVILVLGSLLLGPLWRAMNPLRTLHLLLSRALRADPRDGLLTYPSWLGAWPAAISLASFGWLELVAPDRSTTPVMLTYFALYSGVMLVGSALFGSTWFDHADGFERYSTTIGSLSVLGRREGDGALVVRNPLVNLATLGRGIGQPAFVCVMLAVTAFDAYSNTSRWIRFAQQGSLEPEVAGTLGLVGMCALVLAVYGIAAGLAGFLGDIPAHRMPAAFAHSLVPIAVGYVVAHYYSYVVIGVQQNMQQLSDPYGTGADYLGIAENGIAYTLVNATAVATIQVVAIVVGHVLGVVAAHDRAMALFPRKHALAGQIPLLVVMVVFTVSGITLLFAD
jgi:hypothetical protein